LAASHPPVNYVLLDAGSVNLVDTTACDALLNVVKELQSQRISFGFARVRDQVRKRLRLGGVETAVGRDNFRERVTDGVRAWQQSIGRISTVEFTEQEATGKGGSRWFRSVA
jgi:MFS superfamily sulfate permease-like transporter